MGVGVKLDGFRRVGIGWRFRRWACLPVRVLIRRMVNLHVRVPGASRGVRGSGGTWRLIRACFRFGRIAAPGFAGRFFPLGMAFLLYGLKPLGKLLPPLG